jgi:glycosyltransferase involved in cell wall biosynthesis
LYLLFKIDITSISIKNQFFKHSNSLKGFDVVQFINESPLGISPSEEKKIILFLNENNDKLYLLSCGTDYISVDYALHGSLRYSIFEAYKKEQAPKELFTALKYTTEPFKDLHKFMYSVVEGVIASDMDYHLPLKNHPKYLGMISNPIILENFQLTEASKDGLIHVFLGINRSNYYTKGIQYFEEALNIIENKYPNKIKICRVENLPYNEYINIYNKAHIVLDQVLSYDQGYNALEAMAKGKVVFTGAEKEFEQYYNLNKKVAVNVIPDAIAIAKQLEDLITHPEKMVEISINARKFVEQEHDCKKIANQYIENWNKA